MKTIEEIMGLIEDYAELSCKLGFRNLTPYEYSCKAEEKSKEIESALRELVERKPLSGKDRNDLVCNWFAEDWAKNKALGMLDDYESYQNISITK